MASASVKARIRCEVEVTVGVWNGNSTFAELENRVKEEGIEILSRAIKEVGVVCGQPKCVFVMVLEQ